MQPTPVNLAPLRNAIECLRDFTNLVITIIQQRTPGELEEELVTGLPGLIIYVSTVAFSLVNEGNEEIQRQAKEIDRLKAANERLEAELEVAKSKRNGNVKELE